MFDYQPVSAGQVLSYPLGVEPDPGPVSARDTVNAMVDAGLLDEVMASAYATSSH